MIISTEVLFGVIQPDGTRQITEKHHYDDGYVQEIVYITSSDEFAYDIANTRADKINTELTRRDIALAEANNFEVPITVRSFLDLLPLETRLTLRAIGKINGMMEDALKYLESGTYVYKNVANAWLQNLVSAGVVEQSVYETIMTNWTTLYG